MKRAIFPILIVAMVMAMPRESTSMPSSTPAPRQGLSERSESILLGLLDRAAQGINRDLAMAITELGANPSSSSAAFRAGRAATLARSIALRIAATRGLVETAVIDTVRASYILGLRQAIAQARELGVDDAARRFGLRASFAGVDIPAATAVARDTAARQVAALESHGDRATTLFRSLAPSAFSRIGIATAAGETSINAAIAEGLIRGEPRTIDRLVREVFRDTESEAALGFKALGNKVVTVGGWTGPLRVYASTVSRTRSSEATIMGRHDRLREGGIGLVQITGSVTVHFCTRYLGLVAALDSASTDGGRYPLLASIPSGGPPFHPNCRKGTSAFIPELARDDRKAAHANALERFERARANDTLTDPFDGPVPGQK